MPVKIGRSFPSGTPVRWRLALTTNSRDEGSRPASCAIFFIDVNICAIPSTWMPTGAASVAASMTKINVYRTDWNLARHRRVELFDEEHSEDEGRYSII